MVPFCTFEFGVFPVGNDLAILKLVGIKHTVVSPLNLLVG